MLLVIGKHLHHIGSGKAQHLVKLRLDGDVPTDIESTRHIIQGYRTHAHHKDAFKVALEFLEHITIEAIGMGDGMIHLLATLIENDIGKVVVLVYE